MLVFCCTTIASIEWNVKPH